MRLSFMERYVQIRFTFDDHIGVVQVDIHGTASDKYSRKVYDVMIALKSLDEICPELFTAHGIQVASIDEKQMGERTRIVVTVEAPGNDTPPDMAEVLTPSPRAKLET